MGALRRLWKSPMTQNRQLVPTVVLLAINVMCIVLLLHWCRLTNSMVLLAYSTLCYFHLLSLLTCLLSIWVASQRPCLQMSFGYERCETLAVFSSTILVQLAAIFVAVGSAERILHPPDIATGRLLLAAAVGLFCQVVSVFCTRNRTLEYAMEVSSASWLQEQFADLCNGLLTLLPGGRGVGGARVPSLLLLAGLGAALVAGTAAAVDSRQYKLADPLAALVLVACLWVSMSPLSVNVANTLLQTTPAHLVPQLDRCLREALTLDGVLEFRHEHFWTLSTGVLAGSLHVRVRRDADEQLVLSQVSAMFAPLVHVITVQVFKDDWSRSMTTLQLLNSTAITLSQTDHKPVYPVPSGARDYSGAAYIAVPAAAGGGASVVCNGALSGGDQRIYLSALDDDPGTVERREAPPYHVSGDSSLPRGANGHPAVGNARVATPWVAYR